ncbi:ABC transporter substrate-binding protein [Caballeronia insecticola]|uniref:Putative ABC transporter substrate-binding protein n=1 Tax=Caballeronia insecticola TaxID=758793 RepID=R4WZT7_9BURK|nr:extracellular solute-binding protein [Caballeronia insecticola]BAN27270.1 putative ABC transporter substrate-binding protein [Caballeronia insecticola]
MTTTRRDVMRLAGATFALGAAGVPLAACAKQSQAQPNLALASYEGPDRAEKILAAAKEEGELNFYTSIAQPDVAPLIDPFEARYGIKVNIWRAGDEQVVQRIVAESQGHRYIVDAVHTGSSYLDALRREKLLTPVSSPVLAELAPNVVPEHRQWASTMLSVWVQAYNTRLIKPADLPRRYDDLLAAHWKGKLGIEAKSSDWFATVATQMGRDKGIEFFRTLVDTNGVAARTGNSLLNNLVIAGEVPLALEVYNYMPAQAKRRGAPIDWFVLQPAAARANGVALLTHAPHPAAALLLYDYLLSVDAQRILVSRDYVPTNRNVASPMQGVNVALVDPAMTMNERGQWNKAFNQIFLHASGS